MVLYWYCHFWMLALLGLVQDRATWPLLGDAERPVGLAGTGTGVADAPSEAAPSPAEFTARTLKVWDVLLVSPVTV